jgi:hypothetical protein
MMVSGRGQIASDIWAVLAFTISMVRLAHDDLTGYNYSAKVLAVESNKAQRQLRASKLSSFACVCASPLRSTGPAKKPALRRSAFVGPPSAHRSPAHVHTDVARPHSSPRLEGRISDK